VAAGDLEHGLEGRLEGNPLHQTGLYAAALAAFMASAPSLFAACSIEATSRSSSSRSAADSAPRVPWLSFVLAAMHASIGRANDDSRRQGGFLTCITNAAPKTRRNTAAPTEHRQGPSAGMNEQNRASEELVNGCKILIASG
jgi:hypothetical protein